MWHCSFLFSKTSALPQLYYTWMYLQQTRCSRKKCSREIPVNLKDPRTKTRMVDSGLCEIAPPFARDSLIKSRVIVTGWSIKFEDERMLDMVEREGASFWQLAQNCLSREHPFLSFMDSLITLLCLTRSFLEPIHFLLIHN